MSFYDTLRKYGLKLEADQLDATMPQPAAQQPEQQVQAPQPDATPEQKSVAPEGYVNLVRLLAQALVMNVPDDAIDDLFFEKITGENVDTILNGLEDLMNTSKNYENNSSRIENPHYKKFVSSINENNFYSKLEQIKKIMQKYSNNVR